MRLLAVFMKFGKPTCRVVRCVSSVKDQVAFFHRPEMVWQMVEPSRSKTSSGKNAGGGYQAVPNDNAKDHVADLTHSMVYASKRNGQSRNTHSLLSPLPNAVSVQSTVFFSTHPDRDYIRAEVSDRYASLLGKWTKCFVTVALAYIGFGIAFIGIMLGFGWSVMQEIGKLRELMTTAKHEIGELHELITTAKK